MLTATLTLYSYDTRVVLYHAIHMSSSNVARELSVIVLAVIESSIYGSAVSTVQYCTASLA